MNLPGLIDYLHEKKFSVRLSCTMLNRFIDNPKSLEKLIEFSKENKVEQLTVRQVNKPDKSEDLAVYDWTKAHELNENQVGDIRNYFETNGTPLMKLQHGAQVYDINDQNICYSDCLTIKPNSEDIRQHLK